MKIIPTIEEIREDLREELQCPDEFLDHLERFNVLRQLQKAMLGEDKSVLYDQMKEIRQTYYHDYCKEGNLNPESDNRDVRPCVFI